MRKILLLGGSPQQVIAIKTARQLGLETVLCDYLPDNPGQFAADHFYLTSTTDMEAVLEVARSENIDGVLAYASDPAAPTAAYVAEQLGLPGNPFESVNLLCHKDCFRRFLREHGFATPVSSGYDTASAGKRDVLSGRFRFPLMVKPVDSSGSKGITCLKDASGLDAALDFAFGASRGKQIVVEEFIQRKHRYLVGGDVFVSDGKVILWGLMNCHRDPRVNALVPVGKSYPAQLTAEELSSAKTVIQRLVDELHFQNGAMNLELVIDEKGDVFLLDVGPRSGGNMIPDLMGRIFGVDVVSMSIRAAMGETVTAEVHESGEFWCTQNLHSDRSGLLDEVVIDDVLSPYVRERHLYKKRGDEVGFFKDASQSLGTVFFAFDEVERMLSMMDHASEHIEIRLLGENA